ncbi:hypothetical protein PISMIDRAFT_232021 [Pisolithus microcarpus 441]|uniref:Uncharacterized protein n=1 Tax=Pisolithus microcarpus 441 TaxID=765257 RepID=A0A0D0A4G1_9AGAM|nr:hypothetical protein PISMIDRAFT_232021 [Pisolithus microcarpus 441]
MGSQMRSITRSFSCRLVFVYHHHGLLGEFLTSVPVQTGKYFFHHRLFSLENCATQTRCRRQRVVAGTTASGCVLTSNARSELSGEHREVSQVTKTGEKENKLSQDVGQRCRPPKLTLICVR